MPWEKIVEREGSFLKNHLLFEGIKNHFHKTFNTHHPSFLTIRKNNTYTHYIDSVAKKDLSLFLANQLQTNPNFIKNFTKEGKNHFQNLINFARKVNTTNLTLLSNKEIQSLLTAYSSLYQKPYPYFHMTVFPEYITKNKTAINDLADFRLHSRSSFNKTHELIHPLFQEISKRTNHPLTNIKSLTPQEITTLLNATSSLNLHSTLSKRKNCFFLLKKSNYLLTENISFVVPSPQTKKITGQGLIPKLIKAKTKIILKKQDLQKLQQGDIAVFRMTTPDLISSTLKKVSAIITDEGGITCHAAVVSREFNLPTLIGTKNATKILKDNQTIELDTKKGEVKIIK